jgi:dTDP-4-amino-4,6-dideoxygalactose transaminase
MIPLIKPHFPPLSLIQLHFQKSIDVHQYSNFGPCWELAVERLERYVPGRYFTICSSGTSALQTAIACTFQPETFHLVPYYTHIGTLNASYNARAMPIIHPCSEKTWTIDKPYGDPSNAVVVSPFGYKIDTKWYDKNFSDIVYDFAGAWGYFPNTPHPIVYSLHATKTFSCGEGGLISWPTPGQAERARQYTNFNVKNDRTIREQFGTNAKPSELLCATICTCLDSPRMPLLECRIAQRKRLLGIYYNEIFDAEIPKDALKGAPSLCVIHTSKREKIEKCASNMGFIDTSMIALPYHQIALKKKPWIFAERSGCYDIPSINHSWSRRFSP